MLPVQVSFRSILLAFIDVSRTSYTKEFSCTYTTCVSEELAGRGNGEWRHVAEQVHNFTALTENG